MRRQYPAFGELLKILRGRRSVAQVVNMLASQRARIVTSQGTVSGYEQGYVQKPDPLILWGLAEVYGVSLDGLLAALHANRDNPAISLAETQKAMTEHDHGPSSRVAQEVLKKAAHRLYDAAVEIEALSAGIIPPQDGETKPRR